MGKLLRDFGLRGEKLIEVKSSKGDKTYSIHRFEGKLQCTCIGFAIRKKCRHIEEYEKGGIDGKKKM